jgi:hypothetical protein
MRTGRQAAELAVLLETIAARFTLITAGGSVASVRVLDGGSMNHAVEALRNYPAVLSAEVEQVGSAGVPSSVLLSYLGGAIALDVNAAVRGNGRLEINAGDTLHGRYRNPVGGDILLFVVPLP